MLDVYDSETMIKIYRLLSKKCEAIDRFINSHALYFVASDDCDTMDICNNIISLMDRKNRLINLKVIIDKAISKLSDNDKKVLYLKMNYTLSMNNLCTVLKLTERTAFRRLEHAFSSLADTINNSPYYSKVNSIMRAEDWIVNAKNEVRDYRQAFRGREALVSSL